MWVSFGFVILVTLHGLNKAWTPSDRLTLSLPNIEQESTDLPEELRHRQLPLKELRAELSGANFKKPLAHVALFSNGKWEGAAWGEAKGLKAAIAQAFDGAKKKSSSKVDTAILVVPTDRTAVSAGARDRHFSNVHRGIRGVIVETGADVYRLSPTETVATNRGIRDELKRVAKQQDKGVNEWLKSSDVYSFSARQFYIDLSSNSPAKEMLRGNVLIDKEEVTQERVSEFEQLLTRWMFANLQPNGRMTYMYYPSRGREDTSNNMIRQWMGTVAMGRAAKLHPEQNWAGLAQRNIEYNLGEFYKTEGNLGYIEYRNMAKLGAAALAMISLIESPAREEFSKQEAALFALTNYLWQDSGQFYCFFKPESRKNDNLHNFYPGETLLAWSFLYAQNKDPQILERSMKSFRFYKTWHLENRNPAFIPWHTQAYFNLWKETKNKDLAEWIFTMNDWLVDVMQTNSRVAYDDTMGRFYDPVGGRYGVPHASSTGVYLEGLIDAFNLARRLGDKKHVDKYREAILLGLRSSMQLQFQDDIDMYFAQNRDRLRGGMRTTVYDNAIRVDNVQHVLMGVQKIIAEFKESDYRQGQVH
jgi:hypothetical protein